jgi:steroid 5-alpha reductase family enzyme
VGNAGWTDAFWTFGTGATLAMAALWPASGETPTARQMLAAALVAIWSLRLGTYVATRVAGHPEDARYAALREEWREDFQRRMIGLSLVQAPATAMLAISVALAAHNPLPGLRLADALGVAILVVAILGEGLADAQMKRFKADPDNKGKVADTGLWGWSRHPNYFFEWLGWLAYPVIAFDPAHPWTLTALVAPLVMYLLLTRGSGIPPLEAAMLRSRPEAYRAYQARTSAFFPLPPRKGPAA